MASEFHALADEVDFSYMVKHDIEAIFNRNIPIEMLTDSKSIFDVLVRASSTKEQRIMIDALSTRQAYDRQEIADIGLVRYEYSLADCMMKVIAPH